MAEPNALQKICRIGLKVLSYFSFLPPLITRLVVGWGFHMAGTSKIGEGAAQFVERFKEWGIPFPEFNVRFVGSLEYYGGILLMIGFLTRPVAFLLSASMLVALVQTNREKFVGIFNSNEIDPTDIAPLVFGAFTVWLVVYGPGIVSIDALSRKLIGVDKPEETKTATPPPQTPA